MQTKLTRGQIVDRALEALDGGADYIGFCLACGAEAENVEPDARGYSCEACGKPKVYGAEEIILQLGGAF